MQHFSIRKDVVLLLAVLKTGRGVEGRRHKKKHLLESLLREFLSEHFLVEHFSERWIGRSSPAAPAPLRWPQRCPDLTTPDNSLWGLIKAYVSRRHYATNEELHNGVEDAFRTITPDMLRNMSRRTWTRIELCLQHHGEHTDILDT
ncbi:hypothetical protein C0J52_25383 [Blattella germanica]|nr:hypothetical protein C0J52_25383 [Blattella germanica]